MKNNKSSTVTMMQNKNVLIGIAIVVILVIAGAAVYLLSQNNDVNRSIPQEWKTYETSKYQIGYPDDWSVDASGELVTISNTVRKDLGNPTAPYQDSISISIIETDTDTDNAEEKEAFDIIANGDCSKFAELSEGNVNRSEVKLETIKINGVTGCKIDLDAKAAGFDLVTTSYVLVSGENVYILSIDSQIPDDSYYQTALEIIETFNLK